MLLEPLRLLEEDRLRPNLMPLPLLLLKEDRIGEDKEADVDTDGSKDANVAVLFSEAPALPELMCKPSSERESIPEIRICEE